MVVTLPDALLVLYPSARVNDDYVVTDDGTGARITVWNSTKLGALPSQAELDSVTQAQVNAARAAIFNALAIVFMSTPIEYGEAFRAVVAVAIDEINALRQWIVSFQAATAASTSLADFKTRVAALPTLNDRTLTQAKNAFIAKIQSGAVN